MKLSDFIADCITALICLFCIGLGVFLIWFGFNNEFSLVSVLIIISGFILSFFGLTFTWGAFVDFNKYN